LKGQNLKLYKFKSLSNFEFISDDYKSETIPQKGLGQVGQWDIPSTRDFKNTSFKNSSGTGGTINNIDSSQMEIPNIFLGG
jgi:hypothetical protein